MFSGIGPEREEPGRRRAITWLFSHCTPAQLHGVGFEAFQKRVRPPTVERKDKRAARSEVRSEEAAKTTKKLKRRKKRSCIGDFCWDKDCIFFSFFFFFFGPGLVVRDSVCFCGCATACGLWCFLRKDGFYEGFIASSRRGLGMWRG